VDMLVRYWRKADINRRAPQPRDKYHHIPCRKCERLGRECQEQMQGSACWPCAKTKSKCEPGSDKGRGEGNAAGTRKPAPTKKAPAPTQKVKPSQSQPDRAKTKVGPSGKVPVPAAPKPRRRLVKSVVYVFSSDEESEVEAKVGPSRPAPAQESKAGPS